MSVRTICRLLLTALLSFSLSYRASAQDNSVTVYEVREGNSIYLVAKLVHCSEATVTLTARMENMVSSVSLPRTVDVTGSKAILAVLRPDQPNRPWSYTWEYDWKYGHRLTENLAAYTYSLPYKTGPFQMIQGAYSQFSHYAGSQDEEAVDWAMPVGTTIYPARPGIVVGFRSDCSEGALDQNLANSFNYVILKHNDGTFAEYIHLQKDGVLVRLGERVTLNQPIALSGQTGYATTPHLHFAVFYTLNGRTRRTLPVVFKTRSGETVRMEEGRSY